jgi:hypothetical protein
MENLLGYTKHHEFTGFLFNQSLFPASLASCKLHHAKKNVLLDGTKRSFYTKEDKKMKILHSMRHVFMAIYLVSV